MSPVLSCSEPDSNLQYANAVLCIVPCIQEEEVYPNGKGDSDSFYSNIVGHTCAHGWGRVILV
jgi:hypothetical protein